MACVLLERLPIRKNYKMLSIRVKTFAKFRALVRGCFLWMLLLSPAAHAQKLQTAFSQPFDYTQTKIGISPAANWGIFRTTDTVTITASNNAPLKVYDLYGTTV